VRGYRPGVVELAGACLTLGALVANNLLSRGTVDVQPAELEHEPLAEAA
jgi:hypothetical protein